MGWGWANIWHWSLFCETVITIIAGEVRKISWDWLPDLLWSESKKRHLQPNFYNCSNVIGCKSEEVDWLQRVRGRTCSKPFSEACFTCCAETDSSGVPNSTESEKQSVCHRSKTARFLGLFPWFMHTLDHLLPGLTSLVPRLLPALAFQHSMGKKEWTW